MKDADDNWLLHGQFAANGLGDQAEDEGEEEDFFEWHYLNSAGEPEFLSRSVAGVPLARTTS